MRNGTELKKFVEMVTKEANDAAQAIFDKYQQQLEEKIKAQLMPGDWLVSGNGTAFIKTKKGEYVHDNSLVKVICDLQYRSEELNAGFSTPDIKK